MNLCMNGSLWASDGATASCQANVLMFEKSYSLSHWMFGFSANAAGARASAASRTIVPLIETVIFVPPLGWPLSAFSNVSQVCSPEHLQAATQTRERHGDEQRWWSL